jgi:hypothetical protein
MTSVFRDDHDAALARIDALEAELARSRSDDAKQAARIEKLETQLAQAKAKLAAAEQASPAQRPKVAPRVQQPDWGSTRVKPPAAPIAGALEPPQDRRPRSGGHAAAIVVAILLLAVLAAGFLLMAMSHHDAGPQPAQSSGEQR